MNDTKMFILREAISNEILKRYPEAKAGVDACISMMLNVMTESQLEKIKKKLNIKIETKVTTPSKVAEVEEPKFRVDDVIKISPNPSVVGNPDHPIVKHIVRYGQFWTIMAGNKDDSGRKRYLIVNIVNSIPDIKGKKDRESRMRQDWIPANPEERDFFVEEVIPFPADYSPKKFGKSKKEF